MIRTTKVFRRANSETAWFQTSPEFRAHMKTTYVDTGLRTSRTVTISEDQLTQTVVTEWVDRAAYDQYLNDAVFKTLVEERKTYNKANGITSSAATVETV